MKPEKTMFGFAFLALVTALAVMWFGGCASPRPAMMQDLPGQVFADGVVRRAVCIGRAYPSDGQECPGADVDAKAVSDKLVMDRERSLLLDDAVTVARVQESIRRANRDMRPQDLLTVSVSSHGTRRPDLSGDEEDGWDEGLCFDQVWWDDDVWDFICTLRPCRLELVTDTCMAKGNWRKIGESVGLVKPIYVQMELPLNDVRRGGGWAGQLVQWAGCGESESSYGFEGTGGNLTQTLVKTHKAGISRSTWAVTVAAWMPPYQVPAFTSYNASDEFLNGEALK